MTDSEFLERCWTTSQGVYLVTAALRCSASYYPFNHNAAISAPNLPSINIDSPFLWVRFTLWRRRFAGGTFRKVQKTVFASTFFSHGRLKDGLPRTLDELLAARVLPSRLARAISREPPGRPPTLFWHPCTFTQPWAWTVPCYDGILVLECTRIYDHYVLGAWFYRQPPPLLALASTLGITPVQVVSEMAQNFYEIVTMVNQLVDDPESMVAMHVLASGGTIHDCR